MQESSLRQCNVKLVQKLFQESSSDFNRRHKMYARTLKIIEEEMGQFMDYLFLYYFRSGTRAGTVHNFKKQLRIERSLQYCGTYA